MRTKRRSRTCCICANTQLDYATKGNDCCKERKKQLSVSISNALASRIGNEILKNYSSETELWKSESIIVQPTILLDSIDKSDLSTKYTFIKTNGFQIQFLFVLQTIAEKITLSSATSAIQPVISLIENLPADKISSSQLVQEAVINEFYKLATSKNAWVLKIQSVWKNK